MPSPTKQQQIEREVNAILRRPFGSADLEWKLFSTSRDKSVGRVAPYLTARAVQDRLNEGLGYFGWSTEQVMGALGISLGLTCHIGDRSITRWGEAGYTTGGGDADPGGVKGAASNALKRAGSKFEIGEYLYHLPVLWVPIEKIGNTDKYRMTREGPGIAFAKFPDWALPPKNGQPQTARNPEPRRANPEPSEQSAAVPTTNPNGDSGPSSDDSQGGDREADYIRRLDIAGERGDRDGLNAIVNAFKEEFGVDGAEWERLFSRYEKNMFEIDEREPANA